MGLLSFVAVVVVVVFVAEGVGSGDVILVGDWIGEMAQ